MTTLDVPYEWLFEWRQDARVVVWWAVGMAADSTANVTTTLACLALLRRALAVIILNRQHRNVLWEQWNIFHSDSLFFRYVVKGRCGQGMSPQRAQPAAPEFRVGARGWWNRLNMGEGTIELGLNSGELRKATCHALEFHDHFAVSIEGGGQTAPIPLCTYHFHF